MPPASIPDYLALVGDSADGFPGLAGWGAKSAAAVLAKFGHIDRIPAERIDTSTNLNGAVVKGVRRLEERRVSIEATGVLFAGSLALFTDGTDRAAGPDQSHRHGHKEEWVGVHREAPRAAAPDLAFDL